MGRYVAAVAPAPGLRLSGIEGSILVMQRPGAPWNCVFDLVAPAFDAERVRAACNLAVGHHELATLAVQDDGGGGHRWVAVEGPVDVGEVPVVACRTDAELDARRRELADADIDLGRPPLLRPLLARCGDHDVLVVAVSHVLADAVGMLRLLRSVLHAYAGTDDPPPAVDVRTARAVLEPRSVAGAGLLDSVAGLLAAAGERAEPFSRVAGAGGDERVPGTGVVWRSLPTAELAAARPGGASFDAHVMAALHVAVERWNAGHGTPAGRVGISQAWNLRPSSWWDDVVVNLASLSTVVTTPPQRTGLAQALEVVGPALDHGHRARRARQAAEVAGLARAVPASLRLGALALAPVDRFDTTAVSNFGSVAPLPETVPGSATGLRAAGVTDRSMGIAVAVCSYAGVTRFALRHRRDRFDGAGAGAFADELVAAVLGR